VEIRSRKKSEKLSLDYQNSKLGLNAYLGRKTGDKVPEILQDPKRSIRSPLLFYKRLEIRSLTYKNKCGL